MAVLVGWREAAIHDLGDDRLSGVEDGADLARVDFGETRSDQPH